MKTLRIIFGWLMIFHTIAALFSIIIVRPDWSTFSFLGALVLLLFVFFGTLFFTFEKKMDPSIPTAFVAFVYFVIAVSLLVHLFSHFEYKAEYILKTGVCITTLFLAYYLLLEDAVMIPSESRVHRKNKRRKRSKKRRQML